MTHGADVLYMALAVLLLTVQAVVMNRLADVRVPTWAARPDGA